MEAVFNQLQDNKQNTMENLIKWLREAKVIDGLQESAESRIRELFQEHVPDPTDVHLDQFKNVVAKYAEEQNMPFDTFVTQLEGLTLAQPAMLTTSEEHSTEAGGSSEEERPPQDGHRDRPQLTALSSGTVSSQYSHMSGLSFTSRGSHMSTDGGY